MLLKCKQVLKKLTVKDITEWQIKSYQEEPTQISAEVTHARR